MGDLTLPRQHEFAGMEEAHRPYGSRRAQRKEPAGEFLPEQCAKDPSILEDGTSETHSMGATSRFQELRGGQWEGGGTRGV